MNVLWRHCRYLVLLLVVIVSGCSIESASNVSTTPGQSAPPNIRPSARPTAASIATSPTASQVGADNLFLVDKLVRSSEISGIDLHVRYVEEVVDGLTIHLSLYNNRSEDLAYVSGADVSAAQLVGADSYTVTAHSPSLETGIDPEGSWFNGGANVGWLTFGGAQGTDFTLRFPGFPDVTFSLDQPITEVPDESPPAPAEYTYDLEVSSSRLENIAMRIEQVRVEDDALLLTVAFVNRNPTDISFTSTVNGSDAVLFDGRWQQYRPGQVEPSLDTGIEPTGSVWGEGEANTGTLTFPRPGSGDVMLFQFPGYPLVYIPLRRGEAARIAIDADLPPSAAPRPTPTPAPTPTPLSGTALARQQIRETITGLSKALGERDREAYLAGFAPDLQESQATIFDRIAELPLEDVRLEPVEDGPSSTLTDNDTVMNGYSVDLVYRVQDVDPENMFSSTLEYTLQQQDGRWLVIDIGGSLPFWVYGPTEATRAGQFWIFYRPELEAEVPEIEREAQQAFDLVNTRLPDRAQPVNVMYVTATEEEFADLTQRSGNQFLGVASARFRIRKAGIQITSQAFYINGAAFLTDPRQDRQRTIGHELTHLVLSPKTMPYTPAWLSEGAAMFVTSDFPRETLAPWYRDGGAAELDLAEFSGKTSFGEHDMASEQTSLDYAYSAYLARYIVETHGEDKFLALYDSFADVPYEALSAELPATGDGAISSGQISSLAQKVTPDKVQETLGVDLATLEQNYETWLGSQLES